ncbi:MAG: DUF3276 family protein [Bacteroidota bacterium]
MGLYKDNTEIYSKSVRAGKRTYFFDIKATRSRDYYLTITESRKENQDERNGAYKKQTLFLYKEDLNKFVGALQETAAYIKTKLLPDYDFDQFNRSDDDEA